MSHILLRNVVATLLICGGWDWFLYFSPLAAKLHKYKINPVYPSMKQIRHDAGVTGRSHLVLCSAPSVPQPVVQSRRRPLIGPSPG